MDRKQMISFVLFTAPVLALVYRVLPEIIFPICGLFATYLIINRQEVKKKTKSKNFETKTETITVKTEAKHKITAQKIKIGATARNN